MYKGFLYAVLLMASSSVSAQTVFKIATLSPDGSRWMTELRSAAEEIKEKTNNRVKLKFYPGGVMGDDKAVLRKMRIGQLHGAAFTNGSLNKHFPDVQIYNLILQFRDLDEIDYVRERMDNYIIEGLKKNGLVCFGLTEIGFAYLMSQHPIASITDLRKAKTWIPEGNHVAAEAVDAFSVTPIPLPIRDVLVALQTGMIDTVAGSPTGAITLQWHTQVSYLTDLPLSYIYGILALDKKRFSHLSTADQDVVASILAKTSKKLDHYSREDNVSAMQAIVKQGVSVIKPNRQAIEELEALIEPANTRLISHGKLSKDAVLQLRDHLSDYRAQRN